MLLCFDAQREENALKLGAKIRIFIGLAKNLNKKSFKSGKNVAFCNVYVLVEGLFDITDWRNVDISLFRYTVIPECRNEETFGTGIFRASKPAIFILV